MILTHVTITGADDSVDPADLARISAEAPFIEWAILFSWDREGTPRYPSKEWRKEFYKAAPNVRRAAHLCGSGVLGHFSAGGFDLQQDLLEYQRIQLNFNASRIDPDILDGLVFQWKSDVWKDKNGNDIEFITQHNEANADIHNVFSGHWLFNHFNHQVLFDGSGGAGKSPASWPSPLLGIKCGYAGGLGADNLRHEMQKIMTAVANDPDPYRQDPQHQYTWIDMESKVRTDEKLDLQKVGEVIQIVNSMAGDGLFTLI